MKAEEILRKVRYDFPQTGAIVVGLSGGAELSVKQDTLKAVSYTHLTLPTIRLV